MRCFARGCKTSPCAASRTSGAMSKMPAKPRRFSRTRRHRHVSSVSCPCSSASTRRAAWFSVLAANQDSMPPLSKAHRISGRPATYPSRAQVLVVSRSRCTSSGSTSTSRLRAMWRQARVATCAIARLAPKRPLWGAWRRRRSRSSGKRASCAAPSTFRVSAIPKTTATPSRFTPKRRASNLTSSSPPSSPPSWLAFRW